MHYILSTKTLCACSNSSDNVPTNIPCRSKTVKLEMAPGIEHSDIPVMTDEEGSIIDISKNEVYATTLKDVKSQYCFGLPYQDHNYGAQPPPTPPSYSPCPSPAAVVAIVDEDTNHSVASTTTEEAPEESITRCICGFEHDDEYMICCDSCLVWQHVDCMGLDRNNIPETYLCEKCEPRKLDKHKAKLLQARKKVVLTKIPPVKQEPNANNLVYGKNYKKKTLPNSPEKWHQGVTNASQSQKFYGSTDTEDDSKTNERRPKTRNKRRRKEDEKEMSSRKGKLLPKNRKDKMEIKSSRLRRRTKESTSTADEEAQDAWAYNMEWCEENFESAVANQYTPEVQHLARLIKPQGFERKFFDQLQSKQCHILDDGKKKQLVSLYDIPRNQPLIEYKGKYLLASQFHDLHPLYNKRLYPYIMFYKVDDTEICVDSSMYGNHARFVRRSCKPNAEMRHMAYNGNLHLFLQSTKVIFSEDEITVPLNFNQCENIKDIVCACGTEDCFMKPKRRNGSVESWKIDKKLEKNYERKRIPLVFTPEKKQVPLVFSPEKKQIPLVFSPEKKPFPVFNQEKRRRTRRSTFSAEDDTSQPAAAITSPEKPKPSPVKTEPPEPPVFHSEINEQVIEMKAPSSDHENDEHSIENRKKMTREQRKIEAYMRAFNQMEKAQRRKQQALEKQKQHNPKSENSPEKSTNCVESSLPKEEEKTTSEPDLPIKEELLEEEVKKEPLPAPPKPKKGKRRRGSGTSSRRRTRTNSGGSDILPTLEEVKQIMNESLPELPVPPLAPEPAVETTTLAPPPTPPTPPPLAFPSEESPYALKTKKSLLHERFKEESERSLSRASASSPRSIHTEMKWNTSANSSTCYVFCTKSTSGSSLAPNLLRSNSSGHLRTVGSPASVSQSKTVGSQGSAKKRWLRQAMHDCPADTNLSMDTSSMEHLDSVCLSPICHGDVDSPGTSTDDILTPLKKRRLMRESIESLSSPHSPSLDNGMDDTDATTSSLTNDTQIDQKIDTIDHQLVSAKNDNSVQFSFEEEDNSSCKMEDKQFEFAEENDTKEETFEKETRLGTSSFEVVSIKSSIDSEKDELSRAEETIMEIDCQTNYQTSPKPEQKDSTVFPLNNGYPCNEANESSLSKALFQNTVLKSTYINENSPKSNVNSECNEKLSNALIDGPIKDGLKAVPVNDAFNAVHVSNSFEAVSVKDVHEAVPVNDVLETVPVKDILDIVTVRDGLEDLPVKKDGVEAVPVNDALKVVKDTLEAASINNGFVAVPVNNGLEALPVNDGLEALFVNDGHETLPVNDRLEALPVSDGLEALPVNDGPEALPVNNRLEVLPVNDGLEALPVNNRLQALPVNDRLQALPVNDRLEALPVKNRLEAEPVNDALKAVPVYKDESLNVAPEAVLVKSDLPSNKILDVVPINSDVPLNKMLEIVPVNSDLTINKELKVVPVNSNILLNKELKTVPVNSDIILAQTNSANQSVKAIKVDNTNNENILAQKQSLNSSTAEVTRSPVNKLSSIDIPCASPITHVLELTAEAKIESPDDKSIEHLPKTETCTNHLSNIKSTMQDLSSNEKNSSETDSVDVNKVMQNVDKDNHSETDRPSNLSVTYEKTVCSSDSSSSNIAANSKTVDTGLLPIKHSIENTSEIMFKANGIKDSQSQLAAEDTSVKACASATKKRKVSLSEYRLRMRENTSKSRSNSDLGKSSVDGILGTEKKLPAKVTLAPLPLFIEESAKEQSIKKSVASAKKKREVALIEEDPNQDTTEHRENLNERLKREFGFDFSEDFTGLTQGKSKCNNQTTSDPSAIISNLHLDPQSLPPPPPPPRGMPRPIRPPQTTMGKVPANIPSQYGFVHSAFPRPPFGMPQVPGAPYIPPQPPLLPGGIHPMPPTAPPCNLRAPLLPSTHSFTPGAPLLRTPTRHDYTPVNAQRFASMPPRPTHYAYPSGLYK